MSKVEGFNKVFIEFCNDLLTVYPDLEDKIQNAKKRVEEKMTTKYYLEYYIRHVLPYSDYVVKCDGDGLTKENISLIHGVKFNYIWNKDLSVGSKHAIWRYLHTFYLLTQGYNKLDVILEKYKDHEQYEKIKEVLDNHESNLSEIMKSSSKFAEEILLEQKEQNPKNIFENMDEKKFEDSFLNSNIGNLAKEISEEINPEDFSSIKNTDDLFGSLLSGKENGGLTKIISQVGNKLQNKLQTGELNEQKLINEATQMMGMLNPSLQKMAGGGGGLGGFGNLFSAMSGMAGGGGNKKNRRRRNKRKSENTVSENTESQNETNTNE